MIFSNGIGSLPHDEKFASFRRFETLRRVGDDLAQRSESSLATACTQRDHSEAKTGDDCIRMALQVSVVGASCLLEPAELLVNRTEVELRFEQFGIDCQSMFEPALRKRQVPAAISGECQVIRGARAKGRLLVPVHQLQIGGTCAGSIRSKQSDAAVVASLFEFRIALERGRERLDCGCGVTAEQFCDATQIELIGG